MIISEHEQDHIKPPVPENEEERLRTLRSYEILDSLPEEEFDDFAKIASEVCGTPIALISLVDKDRQWFKAKVGLDTDETPRDISFCGHAINEPGQVFEVPDSHKDQRFKNSPLVTGYPNIRFYAGVPLVESNGHVLGTICVIDNKINTLNDTEKRALSALSRQVIKQMELRKQNLELERSKAYFKLLVDHVDDYVFETNHKGNYTYCNSKIIEDIGYSEEELSRANFLELIHPEDRKRVATYYEEQIALGKTECYAEFRVNLEKSTRSSLIVGQKSKITYKDGRMINVRSIARDITEQIELKKQAEENLALLQLISETARDMVSLHKPDATYTYISPSVVEHLGYSPHEIIGRLPYDFMHPDDIERTRKETHEPLKKGDVENYLECRLRHKDGHYIWFETVSTSIKDKQGNVTAIRAATRNIAEKKEQDNSINQQNRRLASFVKSAPAAVAMLDKNMNYLAHSKRWVRVFEIDEIDIVGKNHYEVTNTTEELRSRHKRVLAGETIKRDEELFHKKDGSDLWLKWEIRPWFDDQDEIGGVIMYAVDISPTKQQQLELKIAKEKAESASQAKANFLSAMSHEIRTPLNAVIGMSHLLMQENPREDQRQGLEIIRFSGDNLLSLVNDILDYNKIEAGKVELEEIGFDLKKLINNVRLAQNLKAEEKGIELALSYDDKLPTGFLGDPSRLSQVFNNLLSNAIKFTKEGSVQIIAKALEHSNEHAKIYIEVKDTGMGISQENLQKIFDRFTQAERHITRNFGGTGLGLSITKKLLEVMGSEIHVKSTPGKGTSFYFELALPVTQVSSNTNVRAVGSELGTTDEEPEMKILLVEDNPTNQLVASKFLKNWGMEVSIANDGEEAVEMIRSQSYDLVLMDLQMPKKDGFTASMEIREIEGAYFKNVPILALTASSDNETAMKIKDFGMTDIIFKPFHPKDLHRKIIRYRNKQMRLYTTKRQTVIQRINPAVEDNLVDLADGNIPFLLELVKSLRINLCELIEVLPRAVGGLNRRDSDLIIHKMKLSFNTLKQDELYENMRACANAMGTERFDNEEFQTIMKKVQRMEESLRELEKKYAIKAKSA